ncbi:uncharacterized protein LOC125033965 [Penaeus chinensis]|uniref:uncharacterized protein LOC125033965 n=1 Tax=Penaeus chinensis TaxID=139456 RepID=UPI001FB6C18D|nr:uncharacterized protein LOC125033965 [Penaeus chinensis]
MDSPDEGEGTTVDGVSSGRRLRARPTKVETDDDVSESGRGRAKHKKRKAEVNIESLYLQENNREVCPTPLETIYETPQKQRKSGQRKGSASRKISEDEETRQLGMRGSDDVSTSTVMSGKKIKRLCMFTSHYYPTKQKVRLRKDRARKMKQLKGVKIPKGSAVTVQDVKEVLAKLSDDESEQNENNQNTSNCSMLSMNSSVSFYVGNIIRPDTNDENFQGMIQDLQALQFNLPKESIDEENPTREVTDPVLAALYNLDDPIPFLDEIPKAKPTSQSREKKARRRSSKLSGCLLPSVDRETTEQSMSSVKSGELLPNTMDSRFTDTDQMPGSASETALSQITEYCSSDMHVASIDTVKEETSALRCGTKRRKTTKEKPLKSAGLAKRGSEVSDLELVKKMRGSKSANKNDGEVHRCTESPDFTCKGNELKFETLAIATSSKISVNVFSEDDLPNPTDFKPKVTRVRGTKRQRGKRRASGIQRSLYHNQAAVALAHYESSSPESFVKDSSSEDQQTLNSENSELIRTSPTSPSTQMAALSLHCDLPFTSSMQDTETQAEQQKQRASRKGRRRSSRISIGPSSPSQSNDHIKSNLGSFWDTASPKVSSESSKPISSGASEGLHVTSESAPQLLEMPYSGVIAQTIDNREKEVFLVSPVNLENNKIDEEQPLREIISSINNQGGTINMPTSNASSAVFMANLPDVLEDDHHLSAHANRDDNTGNQDPENFTLYSFTDHRTPRKDEECIWDMFRPKPKQKSKQESTKVPVQNTLRGKKSPDCRTNEGVSSNVKRGNGKTKSLQKGLKRKDLVLKNPTSVLDLPNSEPEVQHSDQVSSTAAGFSDVSRQHLLEDKSTDILWDSPVISGMFEGKASIRLGKIYQNKEAVDSSPITTSLKYQPVLSTQTISSAISAKLPSLKEEQSEELQLIEQSYQPQENLEGYQ